MFFSTQRVDSNNVDFLYFAPPVRMAYIIYLGFVVVSVYQSSGIGDTPCNGLQGKVYEVRFQASGI